MSGGASTSRSLSIPRLMISARTASTSARCWGVRTSLPDSSLDTLLLELDALGVKSWMATVKYLTIWGYYTSEIGVRQELQQGPPPGRYDGCAPYVPRTRASSPAADAGPDHHRGPHAAE